MVTLLVSVAAGLGAVLRYAVDRAVARAASRWPAGTLVVNLSGSLLLGLLVGLAAHHGVSERSVLVIGTGFAGGYTTLSTWAWESLALGLRGDRGAAVLNVIGSIALGLGAAAAGLGLALL